MSLPSGRFSQSRPFNQHIQPTRARSNHTRRRRRRIPAQGSEQRKHQRQPKLLELSNENRANDNREIYISSISAQYYHVIISRCCRQSRFSLVLLPCSTSNGLDRGVRCKTKQNQTFSRSATGSAHHKRKQTNVDAHSIVRFALDAKLSLASLIIIVQV